ncbi:MAG TPA: lipid-A-disaccharide synthase N-terminal domain-containing protein [Candidatus Sumerlaeota bacterium]|nr:MAG: Undecaprenyl phosphate-alpha-4-amino-4-deoxy-L-arabinose arabinosyl transferase [candidate division BRC1 bacterium ADurb.Bin183]HOE63686.1 lipid-A-disaccharide synthase N-terminal domain-containing protein [Candidatus Sumerlaeota bacterium]HRR32210.1 lipid-A-disaccharide synthase N-terminal domain-containing protein [Candidatus Sumerlaeia bacterium]HON49828.1 lipid-A-disaccharide synthase N-terminal domain-containing protein [Candidatus Sumerlaeota bacterium]HOR63924.1 lipid-A-disacchar
MDILRDKWVWFGMAGNLIFSARVIIQWFASEKAKKSVAPRIYWWISLIAAAILIAYSLHRSADPKYKNDPNALPILVGLIVSLVPYIRNLMISYNARRRWHILSYFFSACVFIICIILLTRAKPHITWTPVFFIGWLGSIIWYTRFLWQWIYSERSRESAFPISFWYLSLAGLTLISIYIIIMKDPVYILGNVFNIIPISRNILIMKKIRVLHAIFQSAEKRPYLTAAIIVLAILLLPAWLRPPQLPDEGRYAEVARDMLVKNNWLTPELNGVPHLTKPPLFYACAAAMMVLVGQHIFAVRLVSILAFLAGIFAGIRWARRHAGVRAAGLAAIFGAAMLQSLFVGHFADLNCLFTFWLTLSLLCFYNAASNPKDHWAWAGAWLFFALGFNTKGPPALMIIILTLVAYRFVSGKRYAFPWTKWLWGIALYLAVSLPWFIWIVIKEGERLISFWGIDIFRRTAAGGSESEGGLPGFYILVFFIGGLPWSFMIVHHLIKSLKGAPKSFRALLMRARGMPPPQLWLLCWFLATMLSFSLLMSKMISYVQPAYPAFSLLLALLYADMPKETENKLRIPLLAAIAVPALLLWGWAFYGNHLVKKEKPDIPRLASKIIEPNWIANRLAQMRERPFMLVQYRDFEEIFNFAARRDSELIRSAVHREWKVPRPTREHLMDLNRWVDEGRPIALVCEVDKYDEGFPEIMAKLTPLFIGQRFAFLVSQSVLTGAAE